MPLSFAITAYNEMTAPQQYGGRLMKCISAAVDHSAVGEVVISNDGPAGLDEVAKMLEGMPKVKLFSNPIRMGVFTNKIEAIARATNDWVITCDSDNVMDGKYIDYIRSLSRSHKMFGLPRSPKTWYCASFAKPQFNYRRLVGRWDIDSIGQGFFDALIAACAINTGNQTVNRLEFMKVFERFRGVRRFDMMLPNYMNLSEEERQTEDWHLVYGACDSVLLNIEWFLAGGSLEICEKLEYDHAVHVDKSGSNYDRAPADKERLALTLRQHLAQGTLRTMQ